MFIDDKIILEANIEYFKALKIINKFNFINKQVFLDEVINIDNLDFKRFYRSMRNNPSYKEMGLMINILNKEVNNISNNIEKDAVLTELNNIRNILLENKDEPMKTKLSKLGNFIGISIVGYVAVVVIAMSVGIQLPVYITNSLDAVNDLRKTSLGVFAYISSKLMKGGDKNKELSKEKYNDMIQVLDIIINKVNEKTF